MPDGLDVQRRVAAGAPGVAEPGGALLLETSRDQAPATAELVRAAGLRAGVRRDEDLAATAVVGVR